MLAADLTTVIHHWQRYHNFAGVFITLLRASSVIQVSLPLRTNDLSNSMQNGR